MFGHGAGTGLIMTHKITHELRNEAFELGCHRDSGGRGLEHNVPRHVGLLLTTLYYPCTPAHDRVQGSTGKNNPRAKSLSLAILSSSSTLKTFHVN